MREILNAVFKIFELNNPSLDSTIFQALVFILGLMLDEKRSLSNSKVSRDGY